MDMISYGIASKAGASEKKTRNTTLGAGVKKDHPNVKSRIDSIDKAFDGIIEQANHLIINDTINIMKANAKLNVIAKTAKYKMNNMIFDDLLDLSGIDTVKSSGYVHNAGTGTIETLWPATLITKEEVLDNAPSKMILTAEEEKACSYSVSIDDGETWEPIKLDQLYYFKKNEAPADKSLRIKVDMPSGSKLLNYGLTWA